ncbi:uncharacterized protein LTR77_009367 [Saxophila tyrrhenica]|uniref:ABM domain-containing protein n=1 Tax=Saxophila tyrrhenica TaxID=1690608 RepID=A0AAV9NYV2_9PEZI|nr:hypothetical protein LTR77_009367 [Saxophila tyrrhenica]
MYYAAFEGTVPEEKNALSGRFYNTLLPKLKQIDGFTDESGFVSRSDKHTSLTLSRWEDVAALKRWRNEETHLRIQNKASSDVYSWYRLRIGPSETHDGIEHDEDGMARIMVMVHKPKDAEKQVAHGIEALIDRDAGGDGWNGLVDFDEYEGETGLLWLTGWRTPFDAARFMNAIRADSGSVTCVRVERDYTKVERRQAPSETPGVRQED